MAIDISKLNSKTENEGTTEAGRLTANEWNTLVDAVAENQRAVAGTIKGINFNGNSYTKVVNGMLEMVVVDSSNRDVKFEFLQLPPLNITKGDSCIVKFNVNDLTPSEDDPSVLVPYQNPGRVIFYVDGKQVGTVERVFSPDYEPGYRGPIEFDFSKHATLSSKDQGNVLKIEYVNNGIVIEKVITVYVIDLQITANVKTIYTSDDIDNFNFIVNVAGQTGKESDLYIEIDDEPLVTDNNGIIAPIKTLVNNSPTSIKYKDYIEHNSDTAAIHGIHKITFWAKPSDNDIDVSTQKLTYRYIFGDVNNPNPIVMSTVKDDAEFELYDKLPVNYIAYMSGASSTNKVIISITDSSNTDDILLTTQQNIEFDNGKAEGSYIFTLFPQNNKDLVVNNSATSRKLIISISDDNDVVRFGQIINIIIKPSTVNLVQAIDYRAYFTSMGRNNYEENPRLWESINMNGERTTISFDNNVEFIDSGSGWIADRDKNMAMHLKKGRYFTLNYTPFSENPFDYKPLTDLDKPEEENQNENLSTKTGLTISFEFATRNCLNANAKIIECLNNNIGFYSTASETKLLANNISVGAKYREDTRVKIDLVIEGGYKKYKYNTVLGTDPTASDYIREGTSYELLVLIFVDGVYAGMTLAQSDTSFKQDEPQTIRFGSEDCDLDIYNIRIYNKALNIKEVVDNYAYDTPNLSEKINIARRNDIFATVTNNMPNIEIGKLKAARNELPLIYMTQEPDNGTVIIPQDKSNWKLLTLTTFENPMADGTENHPAGATIAKSSFESNTGVWRNQGTSSMTYPWPWRNWDWKTGDTDFAVGDKDEYKKTFLFYFPNLNPNETINTSSKWYQYEYTGSGSKLPIKKITFKKDYASSEMCNNAICSEIFTDMALGIYSAFPNAVTPAMKTDLDSHGSTNFRLSLKSIPSVMFNILPDSNTPGTAGEGVDCLGMMNTIPNKNEVGYLGFKSNKWEDEDSDEREQSWELGDNLDNIFWVKKLNTFTYNADGTFKNDIKGIYEARTPKDSVVNWGGAEADFGMVPKSISTINSDLGSSVIGPITDEQKDIIEFHNWLVDTNRYIPRAYLKGEMIYDNDEQAYITIGENEIANPKNDYRELNTTEKSQIWNLNADGTNRYTKDSPEYRLAKFAAEAPDRLRIDQWVLYYIWREQFWMFDSGFKNLQVYTVGTNPDNPNSSVLQWGCMVRDADTALGIENTGRDYFPPHLEDIDFYTESNGVITFNYGGASGLYDIQELAANYGEIAKTVLNGQFGSIWVNIRDCYGDKIANMYRNLINNASRTHFGGEAAINKFRAHQEHWCESLYNFGMRQYFGGAPFSGFNTSGLGDKKNSRAQWLDRGFYYRRGKYRTLGDMSAFRINRYSSPDNPDQVLNVKAYIPMYLGCGGTTADMINSKNVIRLLDNYYEDKSIGKPIPIGEEGFNFPDKGDAVSYIYGTSMLTDFGDLARVCKLLRVQNLNFPKLREFKLGHEPERDNGVIYYENAPIYLKWGEASKAQQDATKNAGIKPEHGGEWSDDDFYLTPQGDKVIKETSGDRQEFKNEILPSLDCSSMTQLILLDVTNHTNLSSLNIKECKQLQELYARGTILRSLDFPSTTSLKTIYLGSQLRTLNLENLTGIKTFVIEGLDYCTKLTISNCGSEMAKKSLLIMRQAIASLKSSFRNDRNCILTNINWTDDYSASTEDLENLLSIDAQLKGVIHVSGIINNDLKIRLVEKYGNIDDPNNSLYITYTTRSITDILMPTKLYIYTEGETQLSFTTNPIEANTFISAKWSLEYNNYATIDENTGIITRNSNIANENTPASKLTVNVYQLGKDEPVTKTVNVYFYERKAKIGDIIFNDGTFSDELDATKRVIGICFYIDPQNPANRLMCGCSLLNTPVDYTCWGYSPGNIVSDAYSGPAKNLELLENGNSKVFNGNITEIENITVSGVNNNEVIDNIYFTDNIYRDINDSENNYFKTFDKNTYFGSLGWKIPEHNITIDKLNLPTGETNASINITSDEAVPYGYYNTIAIISTRNKILDKYYGFKGQTINNQGPAFERPSDYTTTAGTIPEFDRLNTLLNAADRWYYGDWVDSGYAAISGTQGNAVYYPAASYCFAYQPNVGNLRLNDKFKKYNWFLPSAGELARLLYYIYQANGTAENFATNSDITTNNGYNINAAANAFYNAIKLNVLNISQFTDSNTTYYSSNEYGQHYFISFNRTGRYYDGSEYYSSTKNIKYNETRNVPKIIPICRF